MTCSSGVSFCSVALETRSAMPRDRSTLLSSDDLSVVALVAGERPFIERCGVRLVPGAAARITLSPAVATLVAEAIGVKEYREVGAKLGHLGSLLTDDGGHAADGLLARLLHQPAAHLVHAVALIVAERRRRRRGRRGRGGVRRQQQRQQEARGRLAAVDLGRKFKQHRDGFRRVEIIVHCRAKTRRLRCRPVDFRHVHGLRMTRFSLEIAPGLVSHDTSYSTAPRWRAGSNVRFSNGKPETIGGWETLVQTALTGVCRTIFPWTDNSAVLHVAFGTHSALQVFIGGTLYTMAMTDIGSREKGITLVNIGVGPANAKNITDHLAVLRPHCWLMIGHCGGLRESQRIGDYVLAHAYLREDRILDKAVPVGVPIPALAEIQVALQQAAAQEHQQHCCNCLPATTVTGHARPAAPGVALSMRLPITASVMSAAAWVPTATRSPGFSSHG